MTRIYYWLHAQTQYNIHSPFLFEMYRDVLFAHLTDGERLRTGIARGDRYHEIIYKCCNHYQLAVVPNAKPITLNSQLLTINSQLLTSSSLSILVVDRPHASRLDEQQWEQLKANPDYQVSVDLYDVALLIHNPKLSAQHLLLR